MNKRDRLLQIAEQDVQQDCADYGHLLALMQALYQHLLQRNCEQIDLHNDKIMAAVIQIRERAERRKKILQAFGLDATPTAMQRMINLYPADRRTALQQHWQQLAEQVAESKNINERNGRLLAMHNDILSQLLAPGYEHSAQAPQYF